MAEPSFVPQTPQEPSFVPQTPQEPSFVSQTLQEPLFVPPSLQEPYNPEIFTKPSTKEIGINKPSPFNGDRKKVQTFIQECHVYLQVNKGVYTTDAAKVAFMLSFMNKKEALTWKETYLASIIDAEGNITFPTIKEFVKLVFNYFKPADTIRDANHQLAMLQQGNRPVEEMVTEFRLLVAHAGLTDETESDHIHLIDKFRKALNPNLAKKILYAETVPTTIQGWVDKAIQFDTNHRMAMAIMGKPIQSGRTYGRTYGTYHKKMNERDPNVMDVDAMTTEKRAALMKKGLCFLCEKPGHRASDHKDGGLNDERKKTPYTPPSNQKKGVKEIHALLQTLTKGEKEELFALQVSGEEKTDKAEEPDF